MIKLSLLHITLFSLTVRIRSNIVIASAATGVLLLQLLLNKLYSYLMMLFISVIIQCPPILDSLTDISVPATALFCLIFLIISIVNSL